ncbi:MAG TPA: nitroreductase family deazaflavin-dependent oxidoreductase [Actinocrinis sp.]|nr:nitroreductase family deazaflavin-dependent oxidoreductase [Actinocrinis sp.]
MNDERKALNEKVIEDFRNTGGKPGGMYESIPLLLLHHTGAKSATEYITPLAYLPDGENWVLFAANGGRPSHPGWYFNLKAAPAARIEVGTETIEVVARFAAGQERDALYAREREVSPLFGDFEKRTTREIPVVVLERA